MASISERENREIEAANVSGTTPLVFIHGLWLLPSSWANWVDFFRQAGYAPLTPDWRDDPETGEEARANPEVLARKALKQVADHTTEIINALDKKPVVMGHSTGLLAQMLAGGASRRPRWRSTPGSSAAFCRCWPPCSGGWALSWSTRSRAAARSRSHSTSSSPNRGHSLTIDHGWREVAQTALDFVKRFA